MTMAIRIGRCRLKAILRRQKMTQTELAKKIGLTPQRISDYANDRYMLSLLLAVQIADVLNVSVIELYEWSKD